MKFLNKIIQYLYWQFLGWQIRWSLFKLERKNNVRIKILHLSFCTDKNNIKTEPTITITELDKDKINGS